MNIRILGSDYFKKFFIIPGTISIFFLVHCQADEKQTNLDSQPVVSSSSSETTFLTRPLALNSGESVSDDCSSLNVKQLPVWYPDLSVYLTRISNPCRTVLGEIGSKGKSQWAAMGMPCSGGKVRFRWVDNYLDPKQVLFDFGIACSMRKTLGEVSSSISQVTGLEESRMLAYIPMNVVYWELIDTGEKDSGSHIKLNDMIRLKPYWRGFVLNKKPLHFKFVGYESGWTEVRQYYEIKASVYLADRNTFTLNVTDTRLLEATEKTKIEQECRLLSSTNDCDRLF